jgi:hypothetical protein
VSKTPGDTQNFDCTIWQYADVDGHHTLDVHLPGLLGVLKLRLGDDLGRLDFNGGSNENCAAALFDNPALWRVEAREADIEGLGVGARVVFSYVCVRHVDITESEGGREMVILVEVKA